MVSTHIMYRGGMLVIEDEGGEDLPVQSASVWQVMSSVLSTLAEMERVTLDLVGYERRWRCG